MESYNFNISLSVLNHLGRSLYRSLITVIGEAISNSWDADAEKVEIFIDRERNQLIVQDNGVGMTPTDFQEKFLMIGYSKRKNDNDKSSKGRPFIGRKGIGKLALLSCAQSISILTKTASSALTGGTIDNTGLDEAIRHDVTPDKYNLLCLNDDVLEQYRSFTNGTVIIFNKINEGIKNRVEYIQQLIALYFRFSLLDKSFDIFVNNEKLSLHNLSTLIENTQFIWSINYKEKVDELEEAIIQSSNLAKHNTIDNDHIRITGFIASVDKPSKLKIRSSEEKATIDLFVNGRLREKDILRHIPSARIVENYLYGQIHFNELDDAKDRFTSSREGVVPDDPKFKKLLDVLQTEIMPQIIGEWDDLRRANRNSGDPDNTKIPPKQRKSEELFDAISEDYVKFEKGTTNEQKDKVNQWINSLKQDAVFNYGSYGECFVAENLLRTYIADQKIELCRKVKEEAEKWKKAEQENLRTGHLNIPIRSNPHDLSYASMYTLALNIEKPGDLSINQDAKEFKPIRDALAHTARLTEEAKVKLTSVFNNIKYRLINLLQQNKTSSSK